MSFYDSELTLGESLIAFILYANMVLSITQITALLSPYYTTLYDQLRNLKPRSVEDFLSVVWPVRLLCMWNPVREAQLVQQSW